MDKDYSKGKIYIIVCLTSGKIYIGSTCLELHERMEIHKNAIHISVKQNRPLYRAIAEYGIDDFKIELIENFPCETEDELKSREGFYQSSLESWKPEIGYNVRVEKRTKNQRYRDKKDEIRAKWLNWRDKNIDAWRESQQRYYEENRDKILEYQKQYRLDNKQKTLNYAREYRQNNKEKIKQGNREWMENNQDRIKEYRKQHYEENKEQIALRDKAYREQNKEKIKERQKVYYEANREKLKQKQKERYEAKKICKDML